MADVLSQSQIDALLNSMQNAESETKASEPEKPKQGDIGLGNEEKEALEQALGY